MQLQVYLFKNVDDSPYWLCINTYFDAGKRISKSLGSKVLRRNSKIIAQCHFTVEPGYFVYAKVSELRDAGQHLLITRDGDEITVVTRSDQLAGLSIIATHKGKWKLLLIRSAVPFDCLGFLASISMAMADAQINITLVSTFTNDYVMVEEVNCDKATQILIQLGFRRRSELS